MTDFLRCKNDKGNVVYINTDRIDCFQSCITPEGEAGYFISASGANFYTSIHNEKIYELIKHSGNDNEKNTKENNNKLILQRDSSPMDCEDPFQDD